MRVKERLSEVIKELNNAYKRAEKGDLEAYKIAMLLEAKRKSLTDRVKYKATRVYAFEEVELPSIGILSE